MQIRRFDFPNTAKRSNHFRLQRQSKHGDEISFLKAIIAKAAVWFPYFREMLRMGNLCRLVGFDERQTATLVSSKPLEYAGELYSEEHKRKFTNFHLGFLLKALKKPKLFMKRDMR